ncbi:hypothetical protein BD779DRAFT_1010904 [Infundibulicybe gibba]|nr:hypothetical protein BD779DRAFT_1010904 [Infundibulicybe gibba]
MAFTFADSQALGIILEGILYGAYVVLFILYLTLWRRNNRGFGGPLALAQILLFGLCTLSLCFDISVTYLGNVCPILACGLRSLQHNTQVPDVESASSFITARKLNLGSVSIFAVIDYLAQMILLYRCWIVWDRRWVVVAVPGFLALVTLGGGFALAGLDNLLCGKPTTRGSSVFLGQPGLR